MENFDWTKFTKRIAVKASLPDMYNAWTRSADIEKWFLENANFYETSGTIISKETPVDSGFTYEWSWYLNVGHETGKITKANGKDHLQFTFAGECLVDINLSIQGEYVIIELTQKDIPTDDKSKKNIRLGCASGWSFYLVNLKSVYESGFDLRNKDANLKSVVNS